MLQEITELATTHASMEFCRQPQLNDQCSKPAGTTLQDCHYQLSNLGAALFAGNPELFVDYAGWAKVALTKRGFQPTDLASNLHCLCDALRFELPRGSAEVAISFVSNAIERLPSLPAELPSFLESTDVHAALARQFLQLLIRGERRSASQLILDAVEGGNSVRDMYLNVLQPTLYEIGRLWQTNQIDVAREHFCTAAIQSTMSQLQPHIVANREKNGRVSVTTCVAGDQHEIGIRMVADFFEMAGWKSYYLGANTPTESVIGELIDRKADILGISATITSYVPVVADLILAVRRTPECRKVRILVGGYPFQLDRNLWLAVDADGEALDAEGAITEAQGLFDA